MMLRRANWRRGCLKAYDGLTFPGLEAFPPAGCLALRFRQRATSPHHTNHNRAPSARQRQYASRISTARRGFGYLSVSGHTNLARASAKMIF